jgi:hypothetical protein
MTSNSGKKGADLFENVGKKVEEISLGHDSSTNTTTGATDSSTRTEGDSFDDVKVVDEIESLCMNCEKNVLSLRYYRLACL